jgi:hypothetical protein
VAGNSDCKRGVSGWWWHETSEEEEGRVFEGGERSRTRRRGTEGESREERGKISRRAVRKEEGRTG